MFRKIVIALHGDISARAVPFAEGIAQGWGGHLVVLPAIGRGAHTSHPARVDLHPVVQQPRDSGIDGAAAVRAAFTATDARAAVVESLRHIPPTSRLHEALTGVLALHERGHTWESARQIIGEQLGHYDWVHTIPNAALVTAGVLWGAGDFTQTIVLTVTSGWDTDSNGATAGSVAGILTGANRIPTQGITPLNNTVRSSLAGFDGVRLSDLASRTCTLIRG